MEYAIIIPTYNRKKLLSSFLEILSKQTVKNFITVVVNDGSTDGTTELLDEKYPEVIQLKGDGNLWWTGAINMGIKYVIDNHPTVKAVILQNDDVVVEANWVELLVSCAERNKGALIGCVAVDYENPSIITYGGKEVHPWFAFSNVKNKGKNISSFSPDYVTDSFDLIGRGILIPLEAFNKLGLYDQKHFKHRGDTEFPLRAKKAGMKLLVTYGAVVKEMRGETSNIDIKKHYTLWDFRKKFFDFRSSAYWKYRYYYSKINSETPLQFLIFFSCEIVANLKTYFCRLKLI